MMENRPTESGGKIEVDKNGQCYSVIGNSKLLIEDETGSTISSLLRIQNNLEDKNYESSIFKIWLMLNCRKTVDLIRGSASLSDITDPNAIELKKTPEIDIAMSEDIRDRAGIVQMFKDLNQFVQKGRRPILFGREDPGSGFEDSEFYNKHWLVSALAGSEFPQTLHIFEFKDNTPEGVRRRFAAEAATEDDFKKLGFTHTIEVLGIADDGTVHCVHKHGPKPTDKVVLQNGEDVQKRIQFGPGSKEEYDQYEHLTFVAIAGSVDFNK